MSLSNKKLLVVLTALSNLSIELTSTSVKPLFFESDSGIRIRETNNNQKGQLTRQLL